MPGLRNNSHFLRMIGIICMFFMISGLVSAIPSETIHANQRLQNPQTPVVVVIDPGHGGENNGTTEFGFCEKDMNMTTAKALYDELSKFEGIKVYLTHWDDVDLTLKDRAKYAAEKNADFLISIHYNASESHALFGSEVWISLFPEYHNYGYQLGTEFLREFKDMGLHLRGIKTKPHSKGKDYYGVIRESVTLGIPAIIVEHCHVDHPHDNGFCDSEEELKAFGVADAHAIAKYFGLKSASAGLDYSNYELASVTAGQTVKRAMYDEVAPEECTITVKEALYEEDRVELIVRARDEQSNLIDYSYSLDGGNTFSLRYPLPAGDILSGEFPEEFEIEVEIPDGTSPELCLLVYNPYDQTTESNHLTFSQVFQKKAEVIPAQEEASFEDATATLFPSKEANANERDPKEKLLETILDLAKIVIPVVGVLFLFLLFCYFISHRKNRRK